jgi:hypothetical protein
MLASGARRVERIHIWAVEDADSPRISLTTMARLERQHRSPCRTRTLARLAAALGEYPASLSIVASPTG